VQQFAWSIPLKIKCPARLPYNPKLLTFKAMLDFFSSTEKLVQMKKKAIFRR